MGGSENVHKLPHRISRIENVTDNILFGTIIGEGHALLTVETSVTFSAITW